MRDRNGREHDQRGRFTRVAALIAGLKRGDLMAVRDPVKAKEIGRLAAAGERVANARTVAAYEAALANEMKVQREIREAKARFTTDGRYKPSSAVAGMVKRIRQPTLADFGKEDALYADTLDAIMRETKWDMPDANLWLMRETGAL